MINKVIFLSLITIVSCQDYNSNSGDKIKYGPITSNESDPNFAAAFSVIQNRCVNCHSSTIHDNWASLQDNAAWIDSGMIARGDSDNSFLIQRIINYAGTSSNMPQGGTALSTTEYNLLLKWIDEIP